VFVVDGSLWIEGLELQSRTMAILGDGTQLCAETKDIASRFLLIAGLKLNEPIARGGPFVMNTQTELKQAIDDYRSGRF